MLSSAFACHAPTAHGCHAVATFKRFVSGDIVGLLVVCALAGCSKTPSGTTSVLHCPVSTNYFALSLISTAGAGASSPEAAAVAISGTEMAGMPGFRLPSTGWVVVRQKSGTASVRSGSFQLHAVKGTDGSWKIDSGYHCLSPPIGGAVHPTTTTTLYTHRGVIEGSLVEHLWGNQSILVPQGWVERDTIPGGSSVIITFSDPSGPSELVVTVNGCAMCGTDSSGQPQPSNYLPKSGVISTQPDRPYRLFYTQASATPGYATGGVIVDIYTGGSPAGTTTAAVTLPVSEQSVGAIILNSVKVS